MGGESSRTHIDLRVIAQDPSVKGDDGSILTANVRVPWTRMEDGPRGPRFHVVDFDTSAGRYLLHPAIPDSATSSRPLLTPSCLEELRLPCPAGVHRLPHGRWRRSSPRWVAGCPWGFAGHHLHLVPHAFAEANAYYSFEDRALLFGYVPAVGPAGPVYTCLSYDVVVHETTHAVLDGLRRRFLEPGLPDQAALHEGLADMVALLSVFSMRPVVEQALGPADKNGRISGRNVTSSGSAAACSPGSPSRSDRCSRTGAVPCAAPPSTSPPRTGPTCPSSPSRTAAARCWSLSSWTCCSTSG